MLTIFNLLFLSSFSSFSLFINEILLFSFSLLYSSIKGKSFFILNKYKITGAAAFDQKELRPNLFGNVQRYYRSVSLKLFAKYVRYIIIVIQGGPNGYDQESGFIFIRFSLFFNADLHQCLRAGGY